MIEAVIGLVGVVIGSVISISKDSWAHRRERRRDASYSAIRLICILEEYTNKCIDVAQDDGTAFGRPAGRTENVEETCVAQVADPDPVDYPRDISWLSLDEALMHRILSLPNKARSTDRYVSASADNTFPPDYDEFFEPRRKGYAQLALEALGIVDALREQYGVIANSRTDLSNGWNPKEYLINLIAKFEKSDADRADLTLAKPFQSNAEDP